MQNLVFHRRKPGLRRALVGIFACALALVPSSSPRSESSFTLRFGALVVDGTPWDDHLRDLKVRVEERSGGAISFRLYEQGVALHELALLRDCASGGTFNGVAVSNGVVAAGLGEPTFALLELPYLFRSEREADAALDGPIFAAADAALQDRGLRLGAWTENGWFSFASRGVAPREAAELEGLSFRVQESWTHQRTHDALGLRSRPLSTSVVDSYLETGEIVGLDATPFFLLASGWAKVLTHFLHTRHIYQPGEILYSADFLDSLPPDLQRALLGTPADEAARARKLVRELDALMLDELRSKGFSFVEPDKATLDEFAARTAIVHEQFLGHHPEMRPLYDAIQDLLATLRSDAARGGSGPSKLRTRFRRRSPHGALNHHEP